MRKQGRSYRQIGDWLGVHHTTIIKWCELIATGEFSPIAKIEGNDGKQRPAEKPQQDELQQRREQIKKAIDSGKKPKEIAEQLGVSERTVYNDIKAIEQAEKQAEKEREEKIAKAIELRQQGRSYRQIGDWLGVDPKTAWNWVDKFATLENSIVAKVEGDDGKQYPAEKPQQDEIQLRRERIKERRAIKKRNKYR